MRDLWAEAKEVAENEVRSALFPIAIFIFLAVTQLTTFGLPRYDVLFALAIAFQWWMLRTGIETKREAMVIALFHVLGLGLELYKVHHGSWTYPDQGVKILGVPLFSGFMYASVASYMMQAWRRFDLRLSGLPGWPAILAVIGAIYLNFFTARMFGDVRWWVFGFVLIVFGRCTLSFQTTPNRYRTWPIAGVFLLLGGFVWIAEQICTALGAWAYPYQTAGWTWVDAGKLTSWVLMVIISFCIVAAFMLPRQEQLVRTGALNLDVS